MRPEAAALICLLSWSCAPPADAPVRFAVPRPALAGVDPDVRFQLEQRADEVEALLAQEGVTAGEAAEAVGELGRQYHAYDLATDAEICYREALRLDPRAEWHYYLGFLNQVRGELEGAAGSYREALRLVPGDLPTQLRLADVLAELGQPAEAARLYSAALETDPDGAAAHRGLGRLDLDAERLREAIDHFERALERQPDATALHYPLSQAYRLLGDDEAAQHHAALAGSGQVSFADPRVAALDELALGAGVRLARGGVALAEGRVEQALEEYRRAVAAAPENPAARTNLAFLLASTGQRAEAREHLQEALRLDPSNLDARLTLGNLQAAEGELDEAIASFDRMLEIEPRHLEARRGRAAALMAAGALAEALPELRAVAEAAPDDAAARLRLGSALQQSGDSQGAERSYRAALELGLPPDELAATHLSLGNLSAERGDFDSAVNHYDAALELSGALAQVVYNRAGALARLGRFNEAAAAYRHALELDPEQSAARFYLGDALLHSGQVDSALAVFGAIGRDDPHYERARLGVAVSLKRLGRSAEALASLEESMTSLPRSGILAHELALTLASSADRSLRDGPRAVELAGRLFASQPTRVHAETLAMALAEAGRFERAIEIQSRLVSEAEAAGEAALAGRLRAILQLYRDGEPCCAPPSR